MIKIGLTGSIGMGKTTTGKMFVERGCPLHDADATVHRLYEGRAVPLIEEAFPGVTRDGKIDRTILSQHVLGKPEAMKRLEAIIHPLVREEEQVFFEKARADGAKIIVLDIPLLFESGSEKRADVVVVVSADENIQRARVLARPDMSEEKFNAIKSRQMSDAEKRARADFIIDTGKGLEAAQAQVDEILKAVKSRFHLAAN